MHSAATVVAWKTYFPSDLNMAAHVYPRSLTLSYLAANKILLCTWWNIEKSLGMWNKYFVLDLNGKFKQHSVDQITHTNPESQFSATPSNSHFKLYQHHLPQLKQATMFVKHLSIGGANNI
jgi:hypothetical protein